MDLAELQMLNCAFNVEFYSGQGDCLDLLDIEDCLQIKQSPLLYCVKDDITFHYTVENTILFLNKEYSIPEFISENLI